MNDNTWTGIYAATNLPVGLTIEENTGTISGTPTVVTAKADYTVTLTGTNNSEGVNGKATVSITILPYAPLSLTATQSKITDGTTNDGTKKLPSNFMIFDITPAQEVPHQTPIEFLLVQDGDSVPRNLEEFRKTVTLNLKKSNTYSDHEAVMAYQSILSPTEQTSLYLAHDSEGRYPLSPDTDYRLYVVQPDSSVLTPVSLGSFRTGKYVDPDLYPDLHHIESLAGSEHSGTFYMKKGQFFVLVSLFGQSVDVGNVPGYSLLVNSVPLTTKHDDISAGQSLIWDPGFDGNSKPFPFFHAVIIPDHMMDPPSVVSFVIDILFKPTPALKCKVFE